MTLSFETSISYILSFIDNKVITLILMVSFFIIVFFYLKRKSKSGFSIIHRLWRFLIGYNYSNESDFINDIMEIEEFNCYYNTNAVSRRQKHKFEAWIRKFELDFKLISKLNKNLCIDKLKIRKVSGRFYFFSILSFIIFVLVLFMPVLNIAIKPAGLINFQDSGWFFIYKDKAREYQYFGNNNNTWLIKKEDCSDTKKITSKLNNNVIVAICESFENKEYQQYLTNLIKEQQWVFGAFCFILFIMCMYLMKYITALTFVIDARKSLLIKIRNYRKNR